MSETTRASLLDRVRDHKNDVAWSEFDAIYRPLLIRYATQQGLKPDASEELAQDLIARLAIRAQGLEHRERAGSFRAYLRRAIVNAVIDRRRAARPQADTAVLENAVDQQTSQESEFAQLEEQVIAAHALTLLRDELRGESTYEVFCRLVVDGWSVDRVCEAYHMERTRVDGIKFRVSRKLRDKVRELIGEDE